GNGTFNQSGSSGVTVGGLATPVPLLIGYGGPTLSAATGSGTYLLSNTASLNVFGNEAVGYFGNGTFIQSGGVHNLGVAGTPRDLLIADATFATGTYRMSGAGALNVTGVESVGAIGAGTFDQSAGAIAVGRSTANQSL